MKQDHTSYCSRAGITICHIQGHLLKKFPQESLKTMWAWRHNLCALRLVCCKTIDLFSTKSLESQESYFTNMSFDHSRFFPPAQHFRTLPRQPRIFTWLAHWQLTRYTLQFGFWKETPPALPTGHLFGLWQFPEFPTNRQKNSASHALILATPASWWAVKSKMPLRYLSFSQFLTGCAEDLITADTWQLTKFTI